MPVEITATAVDNLEAGFLKALSGVNPMTLSTDVLMTEYKQNFVGIVDQFKEICERFKNKKINETTSLSELAASSESLNDADYIKKNVTPFITSVTTFFKFRDKETLQSVCRHIINTLTGMTQVFNLNLKTTISNIQKAYKSMTGTNAPKTTLKVGSVSEEVESFLRAQTLIDTALNSHNWGSSDLQKDGDFKDKAYNDLKVSLGILDKKYQELKVEGDKAYKKSAEEIVTLYKQFETFDHLKLDISVTKEELDKKVANFKNMQEGVQCNPYESIKKFLKGVRNLEKGALKKNAGMVIITEKDAYRRSDLLKRKHWGKIQTTFFEELIDLENKEFKKTSELLDKCLLRSQRLEAQLNPASTSYPLLKDKRSFNTAVTTYFTDIQNKLTNTNAQSNIDISFETLKENINNQNKNWEISADVVYCIGYIYIQLSDFVEFLTTNIETATHMLKEANGTLDKPDASKLKFGMDIYGKLATVAAFTGPLVNVSPIFAAIWGAVALSGTIVQMVQVVYNRHQAKKTAAAKAKLQSLQRKAAKGDEKKAETADNDDTSPNIDEETDTNTKTTADLEKTVNELEQKNKRLESEFASLSDSLAKKIVKLNKYKSDVEKLRKQIQTLGGDPCA